MNKKLNLIEILKDCPSGTKFYTPVWGEVSFRKLLEDKLYAISIDTYSGNIVLTKEGYYLPINDAECIIFPSKEQRDWSKFTAPWYKNENKFNPKTLKAFDKVLVRDILNYKWVCGLFSHIIVDDYVEYRYRCIGSCNKYCIPYNEETKHLIGTTEEAPEFYRYWED